MKYLKILNDFLHWLIVVFVISVIVLASIQHVKICVERTGYPFCTITTGGQ